MGGGGTPELEITLISPESPVSSYAGESRIFKASVNQDDAIVRWKLDGVLVQTNNNPPANTDISYTDDAVFGSHELKVEAEKGGVVVSKSWTWNVDRVVNDCSNSYLSGSGEIYIDIESAILYERPNGTYYIHVDWFVHGCQTTSQRAANGEIVLPLDGPCCQMVVTTGVSWDYFGIPGEPSPYPSEQVQEIDLCSGHGSNTFEVQSRECSVFVELHTECFAYPIVGGVVIPIRTMVAEESGSCYCSL